MRKFIVLALVAAIVGLAFMPASAEASRGARYRHGRVQVYVPPVCVPPVYTAPVYEPQFAPPIYSTPTPGYVVPSYYRYSRSVYTPHYDHHSHGHYHRWRSKSSKSS